MSGHTTSSDSSVDRMGRFIGQLRDYEGVSLQQLAHGLCSIPYLNRIENGEREIGKQLTDTASLNPRDYPARTERLSVMAENEEIWIQMDDDSNAGNIVLTVYTQTEGRFIQNISYGNGLSPETTLLTMIREPSQFVSLVDVNHDGSDDIRVLISDLPSEGQAAYRDFIWNKESQQFEEDN